MRGMLRYALPARVRRRWTDIGRLVPNAFVHAYFCVSTVAVLLARRQLQWIGHVLRMDVHRVPRILLDGRRAALGCGCRGETLLGIYGRPGVYQELLAEHLTERVRREIFKAPRERRVEVLAADRERWRRFVRGVGVDDGCS